MPRHRGRKARLVISAISGKRVRWVHLVRKDKEVMSKFEQFWDRIRKANKPLSKAEDTITITIPVSELKRLLAKAFEEGAKSAPKERSLFESIFG
jgi:hypothetical protein